METLRRCKNNAKGINLGERKVSMMNFSNVVTLPKAFTDNYLSKTRTVRVTMSPDGRLTLTPVRESKETTK